jgi:putative flippase GtrA
MAAPRRAVSLRRRGVIAMPGEILRYLSVGALNTLVGLSVIWGLMLLGVPPVPANLGGYVVGLVIAFFLNRAWTFRATAQAWQGLRYIAAFGLAYGLNLAILTAGLALFDAQGFVAQLPALAAYTASFFVLCKYYVFAPARKGP